MLGEMVRQWESESGVRLRPGADQRVDRLEGLWLAYGRAMNLSGARSSDALVPQVLDGLETLRCAVETVGGPVGDAAGVERSVDDVLRRVSWVDVGSGGGFPGLVIGACARVRLCLVEPRQKRAAFLELAAATIAAGWIRVERARWDERFTWNEDVEDGGLEADGGRVRIASARAVFEAEEWLSRGGTWVGSRGWVLVHTTPQTLASLGGEPTTTRSTSLGVIASFRVGG